jgi:hypothetical protein
MHSTIETEQPSGSTLPELARAITAGAVRLAAATAAWLRLVAEFDERGGWHGVGIKSCAHWMAWQCAMSPVTAREHVRVARALRGLPRIAAAFAVGRLSYAKVRALTRIAAPDCEEALIECALTATASQTERFCRAWRRVDDDDGASGRDDRPDLGQSFQSWTDDEGYLNLKVRMRAETGAPLMVAIDSLAEREARRERAQNKRAQAAHRAAWAAGGQVDPAVADRCEEDAAVGRVRERTAARRIAALGALAEARVDMDRRPGDPPRREVVIHVDAGVLADDTAAGRAHFEGGPAITGAQARRILCEATAVVMLEQGREPLAVGRRKRRGTKPQRRALFRRDGGCARPGCPETRIERLHVHHTRHWLFGGRTDLPDLVLLCDTDHGLVHDHDLVLYRRNGTLVVLTPDGQRIWGTADAAFAGGLRSIDGDASEATGGTDPFIGVSPIDTITGRRPSDAPAGGPPPESSIGPASAPGSRIVRRRRRRTPQRSPRPRAADRNTAAGFGHAGRPAVPQRDRRSPGARATPSLGPVRAVREATAEPARGATGMRGLLFPDGEPALAESLQERYDPLDLRYAIGVLMGNRDLARRLAAETGVPLTG